MGVTNFHVIFILGTALYLLLRFIHVILYLGKGAGASGRNSGRMMGSRGLGFGIERVCTFLYGERCRGIEFLDRRPEILRFSQLLFIQEDNDVSHFQRRVVVGVAV